jgi:hypothetical protein
LTLGLPNEEERSQQMVPKSGTDQSLKVVAAAISLKFDYYKLLALGSVSVSVFELHSKRKRLPVYSVVLLYEFRVNVLLHFNLRINTCVIHFSLQLA